MQRTKRVIALLLVLVMTLSFVTATVSAETVEYTLTDSDFSALTQIPADYAAEGTATIEQALVMEHGSGTANSGGATWKALNINSADAAAPQVGDIIHAKISLYISEDAVLPADSAPFMKIAAFAGDWSNGRDLLHLTGSNLSTMPRGQVVTLCDIAAAEFDGTITQHWYGTIHEGTDGGWLQIELHNDMSAGTVEIVGLEIWATRNNSSVVYQIGDYKAWDKSANSGTMPYAQSALKLESGASVSRTVAVDENTASAPHAGDTVIGSFNAYRGTQTDALELTVSDGEGAVLTVSNQDAACGAWAKSEVGLNDGAGKIHSGTDTITVQIKNAGQNSIRLKDYSLSGVRTTDYDGDGSLGAGDVTAMEQALAAGSNDIQYDLDQDGQFTAKDISYFKEFLLEDPNEFYLNLDHFNFLSENITIDGKDMIVMNLYAEPNDRGDLSKGYHYVGDAQEGFACLDDTARAVVALAEHYRLYKDEASLKELSGMLEFVLYMQEADGDFTNFVAKDASGNCYKKNSASSYKAFSYWASRGYTALAYGYEALGNSNPELSARVKAAMDLCANRIKEKIDEKYDTYNTVDGVSMPAWNLGGDNAVSAIAVGALYKHNELFPNNATVLENISRLGEAIYASASGGWTEYPLGGIMHFYGSDLDVWDAWGSVQVAALAMAGDICDNEAWIDAAELAADSFLTDHLISGRVSALTPNKVTYAQINYGAASYVDNLLTLYKVTGNEKYAQWAGIAATWWTGNNVAGADMFNQTYGLAYDGIVSASQVSLNSGGESVVEAVRVLARVLQNNTAKALLNAAKTDEVTAVTLEAEDLYRAGEDIEYTLAYGGLNDPNLAKVKKANTDSGLDESVVQTAETVLPAEMQNGAWAEVYTNWQGRNAFFCEGVGHNNVRLYKDGYLVTAVGVGGEGQLQVGDYVKLDFMALVQFDTNLSAEVFAVDNSGNKTLIADDSQMVYSPRTWYSGDNSVKTKAICAIPEGTSHLEVQFSVTTTAADDDYAKSYGTVTAARLFKMASPEIQSGGSAYSQGAYATMGSGTAKTFTHAITEAGAYDIYMSVGNVPAGGTTISFKESGVESGISVQIEENSDVKILRLGRMELTEGEHTFVIANDGERDVSFDALIFYPKVTYGTYRTTAGQTVSIVRDSGDVIVEDPEDPTDPTDPSNPTDPSVPTDPSDPTDPSVPTDPSNSTDPSEPNKPSDPTESDDPTEEQKDDAESSTPVTGDNSPVLLMTLLLIIGLTGITAVVLLRKKWL